LVASGSRSGAEGGGVGIGTLLGLGIRSRGIFGIGVGEADGEASGEADGVADGVADALGCAFCARRTTPIKQETTTKRMRTMVSSNTVMRVAWKKSAKEMGHR
jgi:hypothetical protein